MEALLKFDVAGPRALASHGGGVILRGGRVSQLLPPPIPTISTLPIRLVHHNVIPLFLNCPHWVPCPTPADSVALSLSLSLSLSSLSLFFLFSFFFSLSSIGGVSA